MRQLEETRRWRPARRHPVTARPWVSCAGALCFAALAIASRAAEPVPGPVPEAAAVNIRCADGRTQAGLFVPGEWIQAGHWATFPYERGADLQVGEKDFCLHVSTDGGPPRLAHVLVKDGDLKRLQKALADGVSPLAIWCDGASLRLLPPMPANTRVALNLAFAGPPFAGLEDFIARCPGLYALRFDLWNRPPPPQVLRAAKSLSSLSIHVRMSPDREKRDDPGFEDTTPLGELRNLRVLSIESPDDRLDLRPLANLTELRSLQLWLDWPPTPVDLAPLRGLTKLRKLLLPGCEAADLGPLAGMAELVALSLELGPVVPDLELIGRMTHLADLQLRLVHNRRVEDLSPLGRLTGIRRLSLSLWPETNVRDLSPLARLTRLENLFLFLRGNSKVRDLSPLRSLTRLRSLHVCGPMRSQLAFLSELGELRTLELRSLDEASAIPPLPKLQGLTSLSIQRCPRLSDLRGIGDLRNLRTLRIEHCPAVANLAPLASLNALEELYLTGCPRVTDLSPLGALAELTRLDVSAFEQLSVLPSFPPNAKLSHLSVWRCPRVADLKPLANLKSLKTLRLDPCPDLTDLGPLANLTALEELSLSGCKRLADIRPVARLSALTQLRLTGSEGLTDLRPLAALKGLHWLDLSDCRELADLAPLASLPRLSRVKVKGCPRVKDLSPLRRVIRRDSFGGAVEADKELGPQIDRLRTQSDF